MEPVKEEKSETEVLVRGVIWFLAHPRLWAVAAVGIAALCHWHIADHFTGFSGVPFQESTANAGSNK